jgi:hypothetical protein
MSETAGEEVDYGSSGSIANPPTDSDHAWSTSKFDMIAKIRLSDKGISIMI